MAANPRRFEHRPAVRAATPLLFGIVGPSSSGKTFSALRLATGMQRVAGGEIFLVDTEHNRALAYADRFRFTHVPFAPPFSPLDYIDAIEHCAHAGARIIVIDSLSHEHSGQGGVLDWHQKEVDRLSGGDADKAERVKMLAWAKPKAARRKLINAIVQANLNIIACFRAKEKLRLVRGKEPVPLGFMPEAGEEFVYELTAKALLMPGAEGVPTWQPEREGEKMMVKLPEQFRGIFTGAKGKPLDEDIGEQLAQWAAGGIGIELVDAYSHCADKVAFDALEKRRAEAWPQLAPAEKKTVKQASDEAAARIASQATDAAAEPQQADLAAPADAASAFDEDSAVKALMQCKSPKKLADTWAAIVADYQSSDRELPLPVEAKYEEMRDALQ